MGSRNSHSEDYLDLVLSVLDQDPLGITSRKDLDMDRRTLCNRFDAEGLSFLTKTLPLLGKALDLGLVDTRFLVPREFKKAHKCTGIPAFLQAYFKRVFDASGQLLGDADPGAVKHLRQILFMLYKLELPYSEAAESRVIDNFVATERELELGRDIETQALLAAGSYIIRDVLKGFDPRCITPKHGPGAVATGERLEEKWAFGRLYSNIHRVYPYYEYYIVGWGRELMDRLGWYRSLERHESGVAKVVLVPKDSRGPRLISCEPLEYQWIQQGLGRKLVAHLESSRITGGQINFTNQEINRQLALLSSKTGEYATLDLKEASDRVSVELVKHLFANNEDVLKSLLATRTTATKLPDGSILPLNKFAPMGSALCFPVEALCFWAVAVAAIARRFRLQPQEVGRKVFVYGDDIIVPVDWALVVMEALELVRLKVNVSKSCITGSFRESCGMDAFKGVQVTPTRLKKLWVKSRSGSVYAAYLSFAQQMQDKGYHRTAELVWAKVEAIYGVIPYGLPNSPYPCRHASTFEQARALNRGIVRSRWNARYQRLEYWVLSLSVRKLDSTLDDWARALRNMVSGEQDEPSRVVVPSSTLIRRRWSSV
ncbi:RNA-directed RNA polymerase [ssRNA phage Gerhypos.3_14]|uniref:RNA-directed RNA polymerase n=2 Tax=Leviviricetes TaxID=2842243 RepID=A0A8S5L2E3_9VIRU|nr:RNA-directed RNA polymerase [ssRNA phage Gerhypos.3_14]QDH87187.1 MAG: hypothetical protein H3Bulk41688_000001 [Leviviridae sp.]DAD51809.1 TPA_asm: RNA-directed RNA polymerase [ssRNA phage Gerhypos.3_14]